jgi:formylmethanofuran dehydrogenase subunit E
MYEFFLPSSIDVAVKNDHYNFDKHMHKLREKRRKREKEEKEKRKQMNTSNSVQYDTNRLFLIQIFSVFSSPGFKYSISRKKKLLS